MVAPLPSNIQRGPTLIAGQSRVGPRLQQRLDHLAVSPVAGPEEGGTTTGVLVVDGGFGRIMSKERSHHITMPKEAGDHERGPSIIGSDSRAGPTLQQELDDREVVATAAQVQGCLTVTGLVVDIGPMVEQAGDHLGVAGAAGVRESCGGTILVCLARG